MKRTSGIKVYFSPYRLTVSFYVVQISSKTTQPPHVNILLMYESESAGGDFILKFQIHSASVLYDFLPCLRAVCELTWSTISQAHISGKSDLTVACGTP